MRLPKLAAFSQWMVDTMQNSFLLSVLIPPFSYILPILGLLLLIGFKVNYMLYTSLFLMSVLILGSCSIENWAAIEAQLLHSFYLMGLVYLLERQKGGVLDQGK